MSKGCILYGSTLKHPELEHWRDQWLPEVGGRGGGNSWRTGDLRVSEITLYDAIMNRYMSLSICPQL